MHPNHLAREAALLAALALVAAGGRIATAQVPDDLCSGDPCVIARDAKIVEDGIELDFAARTVVLRAVLDAGDNTATIRAGSLVIDPLGQLVGSRAIDVDADADVRIDGSRSRGAVRMIGDDGGDFSVVSRNGSVTGSGKLILNTNSADGDGGSLSISARDTVALTGTIEAVGGFDGGGGSIDIVAGGDVALRGAIDLSGGGFDGGAIDIESQGSIVLGDVVLDGGGDLGNGGDVSLVAAGDVVLEKIVQMRGSSAGPDQCGDGGTIDVLAGGTIAVASGIDASARAGDCWGGDVDLDGGAVDVGAALLLRGVGSEGRGGEISLRAAEALACTTRIDFSGNDFGGLAQLESNGDVTIGAGCFLDGAGPGGAVELVSGDGLVLDGALRVGSTSPGIARNPARIRASGCSLLLGEAATLQSIGAGSDNAFTIAGDVVIRGSLVAAQSNSLIVPADVSPVILGEVIPAAATIVDPELPPCDAPAASPSPVATATPRTAFDTPTPTATPTPTEGRGGECTGDCDGDGRVGIGELVRLTNIALGRQLACDSLRDGETVGIPFLIRAVRASLEGCALASP